MEKFNFWKKLSIMLALMIAMSLSGWSQCSYTLKMSDSYGDGWNGNTMDVLVNGVVVIDSVELQSGSEGDTSFTVNSGDSITTIWNGGGSFGYETSYEILDATGAVVGSGAESNISTPIIAFCPTCPAPTGVAVSSVTGNSAVISWTTGGATNWNLEYGPSGFSPGSGTLITDVTNPYTITNLFAGMNYDVYVQDSCAVGDVSTWAGPVSFSTLFSGCANGVLFPVFTESWENGQGGWSGDIGTSNAMWRLNSGTTVSSSTGPDGAHDGNQYIYFESSSAGTAAMVSPAIDLTAGNEAAILSWYMHAYGSDIPGSTFNISVGTSPTGPFATVYSNTFTSELQSNDSDPYIKDSTYLSNYIGQIIYVEFEYTAPSSYQADFAIDMIEIASCISCFPPTNLSVSNIMDNSVELDWTTGGASTWVVEYGAPGFTPGTGTTEVANTKPHTLSGLSQATEYEFYVRDACGAGDTSMRAGPHFFATSAPSLSGVYTIGDTTGGATYDFPSFTEAAQHLKYGGVSGPVTFNVATGTYTEQVRIDSIPGASATNTVTFQSTSGDSTDVILQYGALSDQDNYVMKLNNADYVTVQDMTIRATGTSDGYSVVLDNNPQYITLKNNIIETLEESNSDYAPIYSTGNSPHNITIQNNLLTGGYYGIYLYASSSDPSLGINISYNTIMDYYYYGSYIFHTQGMQYNNNYIRNSNNSNYVYGARIYYADHANVEKNDINIAGSSSHYGIYFRGEGSMGNPNLIANNIIHAEGSGTSTCYGIYLYFADTTNIFHNTVNVMGSGSGSRAVFTNNGDYNTLYNNIFSNYGGGYAFYTNSTSNVADMDYNVYYTTGAELADWDGTSAADIAELRTANSMDANSVQAAPVFADITAGDFMPLNSTIDNIGITVTGVTTDFYGVTRPANPDPGAIEFTGLSADLALTDAYLANGICLSTNDSIYVTINNVIGPTPVDFSTTPVTVGWTSTGPVNSNGTFTINSGTLPANASGTFGADGVDLSVPGTYEVTAYLQPNSENVFADNDTLHNDAAGNVTDPFQATPEHQVIINNGIDTAQISVQSLYFPVPEIFLTEICHYSSTSTGEPTSGPPSYLGDDYVEISGPAGYDISGFTFEKWRPGGSSPDVTHTFPAGTVLSPAGTYLLSTYQGTTSLSDFHQVADVTDGYTSSSDAVNIIKAPGGAITDVVRYGTGTTLPANAGITNEWSGPGVSGSSSWGIRLVGADTDDNTNWVKADGSPTVQDPNAFNSGVPTPSSGGTLTGFTWTYNNNVIATNQIDITVGPYTTEGTYEFIATYNSTQCGTQVDTAIVEVIDPTIDTFPYVETFDHNGNLPLGWSVTSKSSYSWVLNTGSTSSSDTGPNGDHGTGSGYYVYTEASNGGQGDTTILLTPAVDFSTINNPKMNFWYHMYGSEIDTLSIDVALGGMWINNIDTIIGQQQSAHSDPWMMKTVDMSMYANADSIRFRTKRGPGYYGDISIDDIAFGTDLMVDLGSDTAICADANLTLDAGFNSDWTYEWFYNDMNTSVGTGQMYTVDSTGKYYVKVTGTGYFTGVDSINVTVNPLPVVSIITNNGPSYCKDDAVDTLIGAPAGGIYSGNGVAANTFNPSVAGVGTHMIDYTYTDANGCTNTAEVAVTVKPLPVVDAGADQAICMGDSATLEVQYNDIFFSEYIEGSSNNKAIEFYNGTGEAVNLDDYAVLTNYNGNAWSGQYDFPTGTVLNDGETYLIVNSSAEPNMIALADETLAYNDKGYMMGYNGDDVRALVKFLPNGDTLIVDQIGRYDMVDPGSGWDVAGVSNATKDHTLIRKPDASANYGNWDASAGIDSVSSDWYVMPQNDTTDLGTHTYVPGTATLLWSNGATTSTINVAPGSSTTYTVTVTDGNGCLNVDSVHVMVNPLPMVDLGADTMHVCAMDTAVLFGGSFDTYNWSTGETTDSILVDSAGIGLGSQMYTLMVTDSMGCTSSDTVVVSFVDYPTVTITGPDSVKWYNGGTVTLDAGAGYASYLWSTNATTQDIMVDTNNLILGSNIFSVLVTNMYGCEGSDTHEVYVIDDTGIEDELDNMNISIYPNPTQGVFTLEIDGPNAGFKLEIMNVNGQMITGEYINADKFSKQYDVSHLARGVYYIRLVNDDMTITRKLIIQ